MVSFDWSRIVCGSTSISVQGWDTTAICCGYQGRHCGLWDILRGSDDMLLLVGVVSHDIFLALRTCWTFVTDTIRRYHTIMNHSQQMDTFGAQLDFQGVILLMWGATVPLVYYGFYCDSAMHSYFYWALVLVLPAHLTAMRTDVRKLSLLAIACSISTFQPHFRDPYLRPVRAATFGSLAVFTMVPVIHGASIYGWQIQDQRMGISWVLATLTLDVLGATAYAIKVSEEITLQLLFSFPAR